MFPTGRIFEYTTRYEKLWPKLGKTTHAPILTYRTDFMKMLTESVDYLR